MEARGVKESTDWLPRRVTRRSRQWRFSHTEPSLGLTTSPTAAPTPTPWP
jgi:hypothetical protein